jgi:VWFA-related protein
MIMRRLPFLFGFIVLVCGGVVWLAAQESQPGDRDVVRVVVEMVQLNVAVTDNKGNYVTGLKPSDFVIAEDNITQKIASFEEGNQGQQILASAPREVTPPPAEPPGGASSSSAALPPAGFISGTPQQIRTAVSGASVFILFDKSNYMYRGFVFAQDAIADFVRSLDGADRVAFYSYSRDITRDAILTSDRDDVLRGVRSTTAGDDAALYNALLLSLKDAGQHTGRRVIVVFSNGPDNASMVPPESVGELAQSEGIPIYMISTREAKLDPVSTVVFQRMSANTGGQAYFAKSWQEQQKAFASIREDLEHLYSLSYYPAANSNRGWRTITVKLTGPKAKSYHIRTRNGYRPLPTPLAGDTDTAALPAQ